MKKKLLLILVLSYLINFQDIFCLPEGVLPDSVYDNNIKTVTIFKSGWAFSYPILELGETNTLELDFDFMGNESKNFNYSIIFCDADWSPSHLSSSEYLEGFPQNTLFQYQTSQNTEVQYLHYQVILPNENVSFKLPGNYAVVVYEDSNDDHPVFIKRFVVAQNSINITGSVHRPVLPVYQNEYQQVEFEIKHTGINIENPGQSLHTVVLKNNQWNDALTDLEPQFIQDDKLIYNNQKTNLFQGGNEYRSFDTKNLKYQQANFGQMEQVSDGLQVSLKTEKGRGNSPYMSGDDLNGKFLVQNQQGVDSTVDAEYVWMKFNLYSFDEYINGDIYVVGGFSNYNLTNDNKMTYNTETNSYQARILVKQGYYDYKYIFRAKNGKIDESVMEGSHYETENDYIIYVYYRPFGQRYDALIGVGLFNTLKTL